MSINGRIIMPACATLFSVVVLSFVNDQSTKRKDEQVNLALVAFDATNSLNNAVLSAQEVLEKTAEMTQLFSSDETIGEFVKQTDIVENSLTHLSETIDNTEARDILDALQGNIQAWKNDSLIFLGAIQANAIPTREVLSIRQKNVAERSGQLSVVIREGVDRRIQMTSAAISRQYTIGLIIVLLLLSFVVIYAFRTKQSIGRVIGEITAELGHTAQEFETKNEIAQLETVVSRLRSDNADLKRFQLDLASVVEAAGQGDLSMRLCSERSNDKLNEISRALNTMVAAAEQIISETSKVMRSFANGDLSERVNSSFSGEFENLKRDVNTTGNKLEELVSEIKIATAHMTPMLQQLQGGTSGLSQRTVAQAKGLESTSEAMDDLLKILDQNEDRTEICKQLSIETTNAASHGQSVAFDAIATIQKVAGNACEIESISQFVEDIAFRLNILSINASIEAARAGSAGRGFKTVAEEFRELAIQTHDASENIRKLIDASNVDVVMGVEQVELTETTFGKVRDEIQRVKDAIFEIANAGAEQSHHIKRVASTMSDLDRETEKNARLVSESETVVASLNEQASHLNKLVAFFSQANPKGISGSRAVVKSEKNSA